MALIRVLHPNGFETNDSPCTWETMHDDGAAQLMINNNISNFKIFEKPGIRSIAAEVNRSAY
jgi:hypothetical protein